MLQDIFELEKEEVSQFMPMAVEKYVSSILTRIESINYCYKTVKTTK
jgi:hypothetical protein